MSLKEYEEKRHFDQTPEPDSSKHKSNREPIFVVQWHHASHLHFDFRLEADGVLKSWAVPKGPSMNPKDKRLAVMVEDHPLDYASFEGEIPEGNYGAGTVKVWDKGVWQPAEKYQNVNDALEKGKLEFELKGNKLKGKFTLLRLRNSGSEANWLLIKKHDGNEVDEEYDAYQV